MWRGGKADRSLIHWFNFHVAAMARVRICFELICFTSAAHFFILFTYIYFVRRHLKLWSSQICQFLIMFLVLYLKSKVMEIFLFYEFYQFRLICSFVSQFEVITSEYVVYELKFILCHVDPDNHLSTSELLLRLCETQAACVCRLSLVSFFFSCLLYLCIPPPKSPGLITVSLE